MKKFLCTALLLSSTLLLGACKGNNATTKNDTNKATVTSTPKDTKTSEKEDSGNASIKDTFKKEKEEDKDPSLLKNHKLYGKLANQLAEVQAKIVEEKEYKINWSDKSWAGLNLGIDNAKILKVSDLKTYDNQVINGFLILHFTADNTERELSVNPQQPRFNTNTGEQSDEARELDDAFSDKLKKGTKVDGYVAYPLKKMDKISDIQQVRLKFSGWYHTEDYKDTEAIHPYDLTIDLK